MSKKQKLELTWIGKDVRPKLEPRILIEKPELSFHAEQRVSDKDIFDNMLIHGDNLLALKALEQEYAGKVKCIYIDPPYNTGNAFEHYDDGVEHSVWLGLMRDRISLLKKLLAENGSIWINLDDIEVHYCKVMCDEIFGRKNFVTNVIWEKSDSPRMDAGLFSSRHDHILVYTNNIDLFSVNRLFSDEDVPAHYDKRLDDGRRYYLKPLRAMGKEDAREDRPSMFFEMEAPDGTKILPYRQDGSEGRWRWGEERVIKDAELLEWVKGRKGWTPYYRIFAENTEGRPPETIWYFSEVGSNRTSKAEIKALFGGMSPFGTPKPEALIQKVLAIATKPGDLVLDSFLGSGTTAAVAHKMGRRWIGIELGEHCYTHCVPRLQKVIKGEDLGGVTFTQKTKAAASLCKNCQDSLCEACQEKVGKNTKSEQVWFGGGGFRFYELGPSLIREDAWGNPIINPEFNPEMLAEALCKLESFTYAPSQETFWMHGQSSETDFIYVTTQFLTQDMLAHIAAELGEKRSLLVCCGAHSVDASAFPNITVKKIPKAVLEKCEWGKDDYSLAVENLPQAEPVQAVPASAPKKAKPTGQSSLFDLVKGEPS